MLFTLRVWFWSIWYRVAFGAEDFYKWLRLTPLGRLVRVASAAVRFRYLCWRTLRSTPETHERAKLIQRAAHAYADMDNARQRPYRDSLGRLTQGHRWPANAPRAPRPRPEDMGMQGRGVYRKFDPAQTLPSYREPTVELVDDDAPTRPYTPPKGVTPISHGHSLNRQARRAQAARNRRKGFSLVQVFAGVALVTAIGSMLAASPDPVRDMASMFVGWALSLAVS